MKHFLLALFLALSTFANAGYFNLANAPYNLTQADYSTKVSDRYASGKDTLALPDAWAVLHGNQYGLTYAQFRGLYYFSAAFTDATWTGEWITNERSGFLNVYNSVEVPFGKYQSTVTIIMPRGGVCGQGSFGYYPGSGASSTEIVMNDAEWIDTDKQWHERILFCTPNWGLDNNFSYNESFTIRNLCLTGPGIRDGKTRIGMAIGRAGECSYITQVFSSRFQYGFVARGGVPLTFGTLSCFHNEVAGFAMRGSALGQVNGQTISGDSNGALTLLEPGYGSPAGGIFTVNYLKSEDGVTDESRGPYMGQIVGYYQGQFSVNIGNVSCSSQAIVSDAAFVVDARIGAPWNYGLQSSVLTVGAGIGFGFRTMLFNVAAGTRYAFQGDYQGFAFQHFSSGDIFSSPKADKMLRSVCNCPAPLGFLREAKGVFDYLKCLPSRTGAPVVPPVIPPVVPPVTPPVVTPSGPFLDRTKWQVSTSVPSSIQHGDIHSTIDADPLTSWGSGRGQQVGEYLRIDMMTPVPISHVEFLSGSSPWDFPVGFKIQTSGNARNWTDVATGASSYGKGAVVDFKERKCRYFQILLTEASDSWLTVGDIQAR